MSVEQLVLVKKVLSLSITKGRVGCWQTLVEKSWS